MKKLPMVVVDNQPSLRSRHLVVATDGDTIAISYEPPVSLTLGSALRSRDIRSRVKTLLKLARPFARSEDGQRITARFDFLAARELEKVLLKIDLMLDDVVNERVTPRMVEEILEITSAERRRWTKDGRLPKSGMAAFGRGQKWFYLSLHPPEKIAALAASPATIARWRAEDAAHSPIPSHPRGHPRR